MHKPLARIAALALLMSGPAVHAQDAPPLEAQAMLDAVVARLPRERLAMDGDLTVRGLRGVRIARHRFDILLDWGASPPRARYTIRDNFGSEIEQMTLTRDDRGAPDIGYTAAGTPAPTPPLNARIQGSDMCWTDLAMDFLWWPDARNAGADSLRGRDCSILEVPAPARAAAANATAGEDLDRYAFVRLWVDREAFVLVQAEAYNARGVRVRKLQVDGLKKYGGRWMIKDLEVQAYPPVQQTHMRIRNVQSLASPEPAPAEAEVLPPPAPIATP